MRAVGSPRGEAGDPHGLRSLAEPRIGTLYFRSEWAPRKDLPGTTEAGASLQGKRVPAPGRSPGQVFSGSQHRGPQQPPPLVTCRSGRRDGRAIHAGGSGPPWGGMQRRMLRARLHWETLDNDRQGGTDLLGYLYLTGGGQPFGLREGSSCSKGDLSLWSLPKGLPCPGTGQVRTTRKSWFYWMERRSIPLGVGELPGGLSFAAECGCRRALQSPGKATAHGSPPKENPLALTEVSHRLVPRATSCVF